MTSEFRNEPTGDAKRMGESKLIRAKNAQNERRKRTAAVSANRDRQKEVWKAAASWWLFTELA